MIGHCRTGEHFSPVRRSLRALRSWYAWAGRPRRSTGARPPRRSEAGRRTGHSSELGPRLQHHAMTLRKREVEPEQAGR